MGNFLLISETTNTSLSILIVIIINLLFLTLSFSLYAMLTYFAALKAIDFIIDGVERYTSITIILDGSEKTRQMITEKLKRGVTI